MKNLFVLFRVVQFCVIARLTKLELHGTSKRLQPFQEMSLLHPCCRVQSITQEQILDDWDFYSARLVDRIMHEIFENMDENAFNLEYVWLVDRRLRATLSIYKGIPNPTYKGIPYPTYKGIPL